MSGPFAGVASDSAPGTPVSDGTDGMRSHAHGFLTCCANINLADSTSEPAEPSTIRCLSNANQRDVAP